MVPRHHWVLEVRSSLGTPAEKHRSMKRVCVCVCVQHLTHRFSSLSRVTWKSIFACRTLNKDKRQKVERKNVIFFSNGEKITGSSVDHLSDQCGRHLNETSCPLSQSNLVNSQLVCFVVFWIIFHIF